MKEFFDIGKITDAHGLKGEVKIFPITDNKEIFKKQEFLIIENNRYHVENVRMDKKGVILKFAGINDMDKALELKGKFVTVPRNNATPLKKDSYYIADIIDCEVFENDTLLGKVTDVIVTGSNDVYQVTGDEKEILIPAIKDVIRNIDIESRRIDVVLPEGLLEDDVI